MDTEQEEVVTREADGYARINSAMSAVEPKLESSGLAIALALSAAALWVASISLPTYTGTLGLTQGFGGFMTLIFGWALHVSWYANPLLLVALLLATRGGASGEGGIGLAIAAAAVALSLTSYTVGEIKSPMHVYGFGFGAIVWLLAMQVALLAAAVRYQHLNKSAKGGFGRYWPSALAGVTLLVCSGGTAAIASYQRSLATGYDQEQLGASTFVKLGPICTSRLRIERLAWGDGPLEISESAATPSAHDWVFNLKRLHDAGVPITRFAERDLRATDDTLLAYKSTVAEVPPQAKVSVRFNPEPHRPPFSLISFRGRKRLDVSIDAGTAGVRSFSWLDDNGSTFCPALASASPQGSSLDHFVAGTLAETSASRKKEPVAVAGQVKASSTAAPPSSANTRTDRTIYPPLAARRRTICSFCRSPAPV